MKYIFPIIGIILGVLMLPLSLLMFVSNNGPINILGSEFDPINLGVAIFFTGFGLILIALFSLKHKNPTP